MGRQIADNIHRNRSIAITLNGAVVSAYAGETLATIILAEQITAFNRTQSGKPRAPYCNMGTCFECQVKVIEPGSSTYRWLRACVTPAIDGMTVLTGEQLQLSDEDHSDADHHAD